MLTLLPRPLLKSRPRERNVTAISETFPAALTFGVGGVRARERAAPAPWVEQLPQLETALRAWAVRATGDVETSRDLVQDTLLAAWTNPQRFEHRSSLRTWLVGILAHKVADHFRRRHVASFESLSMDRGAEDLVDAPSRSEVERVVSARIELQRVDRALQELPHKERMAVLLVDVEGLEREEACEALSVTGNHLRVILHRARNRLRRLVEQG